MTYYTLKSKRGLINGITKDGKYEYSLPDPIIDKSNNIIFLNWNIKKIKTI